MITFTTISLYLILVCIGSATSLAFFYAARKKKGRLGNILKGLITLALTFIVTGYSLYPVRIADYKYMTKSRDGQDTDIVFYYDSYGDEYMEIIENDPDATPEELISQDRFMQKNTFYPYAYIKWRCGDIDPTTVYNTFIK